MPPVTRLNDAGAGHGCWPTTNTSSASDNVITNSRGTCRIADSLIPHACPPSPPHGRSISSGSDSVFTNSRNTARIGDSIGCGGTILIQGSGNVICGG